jgi:hypothetical protein
MEFGDLLTQAGLAAFVLLLVGVVKKTAPSFDSGRFGAILAIGIGVAAANLANLTSVADVQLSVAEATFLGIMGGAAAAGLYDAGTGPTSE